MTYDAFRKTPHKLLLEDVLPPKNTLFYFSKIAHHLSHPYRYCGQTCIWIYDSVGQNQILFIIPLVLWCCGKLILYKNLFVFWTILCLFFVVQVCEKMAKN